MVSTVARGSGSTVTDARSHEHLLVASLSMKLPAAPFRPPLFYKPAHRQLQSKWPPWDHRSSGAWVREMPIRPRVREGMDLFGAAPVELAISPCLLLPGEGMWRSPPPPHH